MEDEFSLAYENRVPCIMPALITRDDVKVGGEDVDNFTFAFIAPLGSDHNYVFHVSYRSLSQSLAEHTPLKTDSTLSDAMMALAMGRRLLQQKYRRTKLPTCAPAVTV
jgi:hypothetical protein